MIKTLCYNFNPYYTRPISPIGRSSVRLAKGEQRRVFLMCNANEGGDLSSRLKLSRRHKSGIIQKTANVAINWTQSDSPSPLNRRPRSARVPIVLR